MNGLLNWISDLVFPARCLGCGTPGAGALCGPCGSAIPARSRQECLVCKRDRDDGSPCPQCRPHTMVDRLFIAGHADDPLLTRAIHAFKYEYLRALARPLADYLVRVLAHGHAAHGTFAGNPLLIPVPLYPRRERERGFNQSALLARRVAAAVSMPYESAVLRRTRHTTSQVKTPTRWERLENMRGAFACARPELVADRDIVLVDDVCTTGATLDDCARALKDAGARSVAAVVLARG